MKTISYAPVRISLCNGGDTDYYIKEMKWSNLINATINNLNYICIIEEKTNQNYIKYTYINKFSKKQDCYIIENLESINPNPNIRLITETIKYVYSNFKGNIKIITNVPEKSGLGGSSSLVVSLIKSLMKIKKEQTCPENIAKLAYKIEREIIGIKGGYQDQWAAAYGGGINYIEINKNGVFIEPLWLHEKIMKKLENNILLFFIEPRNSDSGNIHNQLEKEFKKQNKNQKKESLELMKQRRENVSKTRIALLSNNIKKFSELLNQEQKNKEKLMSNLLTDKTKLIYSKAISLGASAGKISGAGSGGCVFFIYEKNNKKDFIKNIESLGCKHLPIKLERLNNMGQI